MMRIVSFLTHHVHNKEQSRAFAVTEERVKKDLAGFLEGYIVLAQINCCLLGVPFKGLPAQLKPSVHEFQCIYIACTRQAVLIIRVRDQQAYGPDGGPGWVYLFCAFLCLGENAALSVSS